MKNRKKRYLIVLAVVLLMITLGYAILSASITINGNSKIANSTWDIHFDNVVPKEGRVSVGENESEAVINPNDNTEVTYNVTLSKPGDFYEFNVDIVNAGSIDGQVEKINSRLKIGDDEPFIINSDLSNLPPYLNYLITYSDDTEIMPNHLLKSGNSETIKVRIEFRRDIDSSILPEDDIDIALTIQPDLIQENKEGYNKGEEPYTPFTYDIDVESIQNATIQYDKINQEQCTTYFYRYFSEEDSAAYCRGEDVTYQGNTINIEDDLNNISSDFLQELNDNGVITLKYVGVKSIDINKNTCIEFLNNQGWEGVESLCNGGPDPWGDDFYDYIAWDGDDWYIENGVFNNVEYSEIKPDIIITGYKEEVPTNLEIPREINGRKVVGIADDSFDNKGITSVTIPNTVEYIGSNAFDSNDLDEVTVSGDAVTIGNCAFGNKDNITTHNLPQDYFCVEGCATGNSNLSDGYEYSKGQYNYYYIEETDSWGVYLRDTNSTKPVTSKLCSLVDGKPITSMSYMFNYSKTTSIDFSSFDTSHVKNMSSMFYYMNNIKELDLSNFNTSNVENMSYMFYGSSNLETIYTSDNFITNNVNNSYNMFRYNSNLIGGKGTIYNEGHIDKGYAHIDEGETNPGYFTKKGNITVTLNPNGGVVTRTNYYYNDSDEIGYLPTPVRDNKVFMGWYRDLECTIKVESDYVVESNMELIAGWRDYQNVQITFDKNNEDATGTMENQTILEHTPGYLNLNEYTSDNYVFAGWNTKRDGTGTSYLDGAEITVTDNTTLYAQWIIKYTLTYDKNNENAVGSMDNRRIMSGTIFPLDLNVYTLNHYVFVGWNTKADGTGISYSDEAEITITGDVTLYAQWLRVYTLTFDKNNNEAVGDGYTFDVLSGVATTLPAEAYTAYTLTGKIIENYNTMADNQGISYYQGQSISITMDTTLYAHWEKRLLYNVLKIETQKGRLAKEYTGPHGDSMDSSKSTEKIYHWNATNTSEATQILDKNNVIFAGQCWQMIRTTDTGGIKLIYNGEAENGKCLNTRSNHLGYSTDNYVGNTTNLASDYWYGTDYTYDKTNNAFSISGNTEQTTWNESTAPGLIGKYTCKQKTELGTCTTLYLVESYKDSEYANTISLNNNSHYSSIGKMHYNWKSTPADVGYMYNTKYSTYEITMPKTETILSSDSLKTTYWYGDNVEWGSYGTGNYDLINPYQVSSTADYPNLVGKYTFRNTSKYYSYTTVYYIAGVNGSNMYYFTLKNSGNHTIEDLDYTYTYGDGYTDNGDGTYTIDNPATINMSEWYTNHNDVKNKYVCKKATNNTCTDVWYVTSTTNTNMTYYNVIKYASGFTYDENTEKYRLNNENDTFWNIKDSENQSSIGNHRYTCWNISGECTKISYIFYSTFSERDYILSELGYISIKEGKNVTDAINEMFNNDNVNQINSTIKTAIESWYEKYLLSDYDNYIEDTIFCNDRSIHNLGGWNPNNGDRTGNLVFHGSESLSCINETDKFSINNNKAKLKYKIGLMTYPENDLLRIFWYIDTAQNYWLLTPGSFNSVDYNSRVLTTHGSASLKDINNVRPAISLKPGTEYSSGDGSMANPYIVQ